MFIDIKIFPAEIMTRSGYNIVHYMHMNFIVYFA